MRSSICHSHYKALMPHSGQYTLLVCYLHRDLTEGQSFLKAACVNYHKVIKPEDMVLSPAYKQNSICDLGKLKYEGGLVPRRTTSDLRKSCRSRSVDIYLRPVKTTHESHFLVQILSSDK